MHTCMPILAHAARQYLQDLRAAAAAGGGEDDDDRGDLYDDGLGDAEVAEKLQQDALEVC